MKKIVSLFFVITVVLTFFAGCSTDNIANNKLRLYINGHEIEAADAHMVDGKIVFNAKEVYLALGFVIRINDNSFSANTGKFNINYYNLDGEYKFSAYSELYEPIESSETTVEYRDGVYYTPLDDLLLAHKNLTVKKDTANGKIYLETPRTAHNIVNAANYEEIFAPDGTLVARICYIYPIIECIDGDDKEFIAEINNRFKNNALSLSRENNNNYESIIEDYENCKENHWNFIPYEHTYNYEVHTDKKGILSITEISYSYVGGAHGGTFKSSHNYDVVNGKELSLSDLLVGTDEEITDIITKEFLEVKESFFDDPHDVVPAELPYAEYYVDKNGVTVYFQQYQVGPYVAGFVSATVSDKDRLKINF